MPAHAGAAAAHPARLVSTAGLGAAGAGTHSAGPARVRTRRRSAQIVGPRYLDAGSLLLPDRAAMHAVAGPWLPCLPADGYRARASDVRFSMTHRTFRQAWHSNIRNDVLAGIVVALAMIPEAIALSIIAGVDPKVGLYAASCVTVTVSITGGRPDMVSAATGATALLMVALVKGYGLQHLPLTTLCIGCWSPLTAAPAHAVQDLRVWNASPEGRGRRPRGGHAHGLGVRASRGVKCEFPYRDHSRSCPRSADRLRRAADDGSAGGRCIRPFAHPRTAGRQHLAGLIRSCQAPVLVVR